MKVNFISNLPLSEISGGISGMNAAAYEAISEIADTHYVGPVNPKPRFSAKLPSKLLRMAGLKGDFFFFSEERLARIRQEVAARRRTDADLDFYMGFTQWSACQFDTPYVAWNDCSFVDYVAIYHPPVFREADVRRICKAEQAWMLRSRAMLFSSTWAMERVKAQYGLPESQAFDIGGFGATNIPEADVYAGGRDFLFISTDYRRKNGPLCRQAMDLVWRRFPDVGLKIIGVPPPSEDLNDPRVRYEGFFDKSKPEQLAAFKHHLATGLALVHPTSADITAMIVTEAAFHGCPAITANDFAIPEITGGGKFAVLLDRPYRVEALAEAMISLIEDQDRYRAMRKAARDYSIPLFSRAAFKQRAQAAVLALAG